MTETRTEFFLTCAGCRDGIKLTQQCHRCGDDLCSRCWGSKWEAMTCRRCQARRVARDQFRVWAAAG